MISEFEQIVDKVKKLSELTHHLRLENAELRRQMAHLSLDHQAMQLKIQLAHDRVAKLLAQLPQGEVDQAE